MRPNRNGPSRRRIGDGILPDKPTVFSSGDWLLTSSVWKTDNSIKVYASTDQGQTFQLRGTANIEDAYRARVSGAMRCATRRALPLRLCMPSRSPAGFARRG